MNLMKWLLALLCALFITSPLWADDHEESDLGEPDTEQVYPSDDEETEEEEE